MTAHGELLALLGDVLQLLQRHLLKHPGGGRVTVLVAVECALESGRPSGEHLMNDLGRLKEPVPD